MSYKTCHIDSLYFIRWTAPQASDHESLMLDIEQRVRRHGKLEAVVSIVPTDVSTPDEAFRRAGATSNKALMQYTERLIVVIEGQGIRTSLLRGAASLMAAMSGTGTRSFADASVYAALSRLEAARGPGRERIMAQIRASGIIPG